MEGTGPGGHMDGTPISIGPLEGNHLFIPFLLHPSCGGVVPVQGPHPHTFLSVLRTPTPIPRTLSPHQRTFVVAIPSLSPAFVR